MNYFNRLVRETSSGATFIRAPVLLVELHGGTCGRAGGSASYPSGQRDLTVNQLALPSGVRIPHSPRCEESEHR